MTDELVDWKTIQTLTLKKEKKEKSVKLSLYKYFG